MKLLKHIGPVIHILDKSKEYRRIIEECLSALGYPYVESFEDLSIMLDQGIRPDIIILDHETGYSRLTGLEFFRRYGHREFKHTKFIFLSSNSDLNIAVSAVRMGAIDYIIKSRSGLERLITCVGKLVKEFRDDYRKKLFLRASLISFCILTTFLVLAVCYYKNTGF